MKLHALIVAAALTVVAAPALAGRCPMDMKAIDKALAANPKLSEADMKEVKKLRAEGEEQHKAGKHKESETSLAKAKKILKIEEKKK